MHKITLEQKKKAVEIAVGGGDPLKYLQECGSKNPSAHWYYIKKTLEKADPERYALLRMNTEKKDEEDWVRIDVTEDEDMESMTAAAMENVEEMQERLDSPMRPVNYDGYEVAAIRSAALGEFYFSRKYNTIDWKTPDGDEVSMTPEEWRAMSDELPRIMAILGVGA